MARMQISPPLVADESTHSRWGNTVIVRKLVLAREYADVMKYCSLKGLHLHEVEYVVGPQTFKDYPGMPVVHLVGWQGNPLYFELEFFNALKTHKESL